MTPRFDASAAARGSRCGSSARGRRRRGARDRPGRRCRRCSQATGPVDVDGQTVERRLRARRGLPRPVPLAHRRRRRPGRPPRAPRRDRPSHDRGARPRPWDTVTLIDAAPEPRPRAVTCSPGRATGSRSAGWKGIGHRRRARRRLGAAGRAQPRWQQARPVPRRRRPRRDRPGASGRPRSRSGRPSTTRPRPDLPRTSPGRTRVVTTPSGTYVGIFSIDVPGSARRDHHRRRRPARRGRCRRPGPGRRHRRLPGAGSPARAGGAVHPAARGRVRCRSSRRLGSRGSSGATRPGAGPTGMSTP